MLQIKVYKIKIEWKEAEGVMKHILLLGIFETFYPSRDVFLELYHVIKASSSTKITAADLMDILKHRNFSVY